MADRRIPYRIEPLLQDGSVTSAAAVSIDGTDLSNISDVGNAQGLADEVNQLLDTVSGLCPTDTNRLTGSITTFNGDVTVDRNNLDDYDNELGLYINDVNAMPDFRLPADAEITAAGVATDAQVEIVLLHQGGTSRGTGSIFRRDNTLYVFPPTGGTLRRTTASPTSPGNVFANVEQFDLATFTQSERGEPWLFTQVTLSSGALLLSRGIFNFVQGGTITANPALTFIGQFPRSSISQGDAYLVTTGNPDFGARGVQTNDVLVALVDNPSQQNNNTNSDWLRIQNVSNSDLTNSQFAFLNAISEVDGSVDSRLVDEGDITTVRVFVSSAALTTAPFINPSTDSVNNPVGPDGLRTYYGGEEDRGPDEEFQAPRDFSQNFIYIDIDGTVAQDIVPETYVLIKNANSQLEFSFSLDDSATGVVLPGSGDTYYFLDFNDANPGPDPVSIFEGWTIEVVRRQELMIQTLGDSVNVSPAIARRSVGYDELEEVVVDAIINVPDPAVPIPTPPNLQNWNDHITITENTVNGWREVSPSPILPIEVTREYKFLDNQTRANIDVDQFTDQDGAEITGHQDNQVFVYNDSNRHFNTEMPGYDSFLLEHEFNVVNKAPGNSIGTGTNKMGAFVYSNQLVLGESAAAINALKFGSSNEPFLGFDGQDALHVRIGRQDGGTRTRTYDQPLPILLSQWHTNIDVTTNEESEVEIPQNLNGSLVVKVAIQLDDDGNDEGTHFETMTISNLEADQTIGNRDFTYAGFPTVTVNIRYEHDNNDLSNTRRVLFLRPTTAFNNAALTYNIAATRNVIETWSVPNTYAEFPVTPGDAHTRFGTFDPSIWQYYQQPVKVFWAIYDYRPGDTDPDPEQAFLVATQVNGGVVRVESGRMHRPLSEFDMDAPIYSNTQFALSDVIGYRYTAPENARLSEANARTLFAAFDDNLGLATDRDQAIETLLFAGNFEIGAGFGLIMTDTTTGNRRIIEVDNGTLTNKDA